MNKPMKLSVNANSLISGAGKKHDMQAFKSNALDRGGSDPDTPRGVNFVNFNGNNGSFTYGKAKTQVPPDQKFIVPIQSMKHGWIYWEDKRPERDTEAMVSAFEPLPKVPDKRPIQGTLPRPHDRDGWSETIEFDMVGYEDVLNGFTLRMNHSSVAVKRCWGDIGMAMVKQDDDHSGNTSFLNPIVSFVIDSYTHKDYDREVYTMDPVIHGWTDGYEVQTHASGEIEDNSSGDADDDDDIFG